jgi:Neuraminidase (sialidase)
MFDEAASSLPWMANIQKKFDSNGYLLGVTLSPEQIDQMTGLAHDKVDTQKDHIDRLKSEYSDDLNPQAVTGAKKVGSILPKTGAQAAGGQPIVQRNKKTGAYRYSLDGGKTWQPGQPPSK